MNASRFSLFRKFATLSCAASVWCLSAWVVAQNSSDYAPVDAETLETAFRKLKRNDSLQFDLPDAPEMAPTPGWLKAFGNAIGNIIEFLAPIFKIIFWIGIGVLIFGALYLIAQTIYAAAQITKEKKEKSNAPPPPLYQPARQQARILLEEIDALAAQHRYEEAVHTLLFRSIQDIDANRPNVIRRSLTSREIGELSILTPNAQQAFSDIAQIVERSYFGGREIGHADFIEAREAYVALALGDAANQALSRAAA